MSGKIKIKVFAIKDANNVEKLVELLESCGANVSEFFRAMNSAQPFSFDMDEQLYSKWKGDLEELCEYTEERENTYTVKSYSLATIMLVDALLLLSISNYFVEGIKLRDILSDLFASSAVIWSFVAITKLLMSMLLYVGFWDALGTTPAGYIFRIRFIAEGSFRVLLAFALLPITGLLLAGSPFGKVAKVFGIFLFVFFLAGTISGVLTSHYRVRPERA
ncbi:MAG: hypothetical protein ABWK04_02840 [Hydrogenobacter sp.]|uniref:hypothetical protein n=1 Tax=Hydrogenobacter thermophilus TaxID=940 RepID=UPI0030F9A0AC